MVLQYVPDVLRHLRTRHSGVDTFLQLVELIEHEQHSTRPDGGQRGRQVFLEDFERVLVVECAIERLAKFDLERALRLSRGLTREPRANARVEEAPAYCSRHES